MEQASDAPADAALPRTASAASVVSDDGGDGSSSSPRTGLKILGRALATVAAAASLCRHSSKRSSRSVATPTAATENDINNKSLNGSESDKDGASAAQVQPQDQDQQQQQSQSQGKPSFPPMYPTDDDSSAVEVVVERTMGSAPPSLKASNSSSATTWSGPVTVMEEEQSITVEAPDQVAQRRESPCDLAGEEQPSGILLGHSAYPCEAELPAEDKSKDDDGAAKASCKRVSEAESAKNKNKQKKTEKQKQGTTDTTTATAARRESDAGGLCDYYSASQRAFSSSAMANLSLGGATGSHPMWQQPPPAGGRPPTAERGLRGRRTICCAATTARLPSDHDDHAYRYCLTNTGAMMVHRPGHPVPAAYLRSYNELQ